MIKLKEIRLINYCGYRDFHLDFYENGDIKKWVIFYGPNGIGKSNFIRAVELLASPRRIIGRTKNDLFFRRLTYHPNYNPTYSGFLTDKTHLYMEATFLFDKEKKKIVLENNWDDCVGITTNELPSSYGDFAAYIDADNPNNMYSFNLDINFSKDFLDIAETVYSFQCYLPEESLVETINPGNGKPICIYTDFILKKWGNTLVHYKRFSDGEKKIATLLTSLFKRAKEVDILLVDNIEQHIYFKRHLKLLEKIEMIFPDKQIIATTHSSVIVENIDKKYLYDLEEHIGHETNN